MVIAVGVMMGTHTRKNSGSGAMGVQERRAVITRMYVQGYAQWPIAKLLGISQSAVSNELAAVREEWLKTRTMDYTVKIAREVAGLDMQESCLWEAWYNSCKQDVITTVTRKKRLIDEPIQDDTSTGKRSRTRKTKGQELTTIEENEKVETRQLIGDRRFMAEITWVRELRCKLLGLLEDEPLQPAVVNIWQQLQEVQFDRDRDDIEDRLKMIETSPVSGFIDVTQSSTTNPTSDSQPINNHTSTSPSPSNTSTTVKPE